MYTSKEGVRLFSPFTEKPVQSISLEELSNTHLENYPDGTPVGDIYHCEFIQWILDVLSDYHFNYEVGEIFVANNKFKRSPGVTILPEIEAKEGVGSLNSHICRRVFCNIRLLDFQRGETEGYNIAISYTQLGICVGMGPFTYACKNQTIVGAERLFSNYTLRGNERLLTEQRKIKTLKLEIKNAVQSLGNYALDDFELLEQLQTIPMDFHQIGEFIGHLMILRNIACSPSPLVHRNITAPLNTPEINDLTAHILEHIDPDGCSAYDLLMASNRSYKPKAMPFDMIAPCSAALTDTLCDFLKIKQK